MSRYDAFPDALITADLGGGSLSVQPVIDWSVTRQMSGGGLPGQARGASGSSVGSGSVTVHSPAGRSPWTAGPIRPGGTVALDARADTSAPMSPVARMVARDVSGTASSRTLSVAIEDDIEALRAPVSFMVPPESVGEPLDAAGVLATLAAQAGYHAVPPPVTSALVAFPLVGTTLLALGVNPAVMGGVEYIAADGSVTPMSDTPNNNISVRAFPVRNVPPSDPVYATFEIADIPGRTGPSPTVCVRPGDFQVQVGTSGSFRVRVFPLADGGWQSVPGFPPGGSSTWRRVQLQAEWVGPFAGAMASGARVRGRLGPSGAWSDWSVATGAVDTTPRTYAEVGVTVFYQRAFRGFQTHTEDDPAVWATPTARIGASGSILSAVLPQPARSGWETMQEIARATLGWVGIDADGALVYRGRDALRGGAPVEAIVSEDSLDEIPWSISTDDVADRVEVTYRPPALLTTPGLSGASHTVWESTDLVGIPPGRPAVIDVQIEGAIGRLSPVWTPVWNTAFPAGEESRWNAFPNPDGTGTQPAITALAFDTQLLASDRVRITITNRTTNPLWVTQLILRVYTVARAGEPLTVSRGAPSDVARSPLTYDLGTWVQDDATAREILDWLTGTTSEPLPTLERVRVVPVASRRLGQIVKVVDRTTSLAAKALITGISMSGSDGSLTQNLDLTILWVTEQDVARYVGPKPALSTELDLANFLTTTLGAAATEADLAAWLPTGVI